MKKLFKALTCFALSLSMLASILLTAVPASASSDVTTVSEETIQLEDGTYCIVTTTETMIPSVARGKTKTKGAQKAYRYYNASDVLVWEYILHATFMYDDYLVVCSDTSNEINIYNPKRWIYEGGKHWKQGNTAYGRATIHLIATTTSKTVNLQISCSKHGVLS